MPLNQSLKKGPVLLRKDIRWSWTSNMITVLILNLSVVIISKSSGTILLSENNFKGNFKKIKKTSTKLNKPLINEGEVFTVKYERRSYIGGRYYLVVSVQILLKARNRQYIKMQVTECQCIHNATCAAHKIQMNAPTLYS